MKKEQRVKFKQSPKVKNIRLLKLLRFTQTPASVMVKASKQNPAALAAKCREEQNPVSAGCRLMQEKECVYGKTKKEVIMEKMESALPDAGSRPGIYLAVQLYPHVRGDHSL